MKAIRRLTLFLMGVLLVVLLTVMLLSPQTIISWAGTIAELSPVLRVVLMVLLDAALVSLLILQIRPEPAPSSSGLMMRSSGAIAEVSVESARNRILKAVSDVPEVVSVDADVKPVRGKADIELNVEVMGHDVRLPGKQEEINRALKQVINKQLGLQMAGRPRVHIRIHGEEAPTKGTPVPVQEIARPVPVTIKPLPEAAKTPEPEVLRSEPAFDADVPTHALDEARPDVEPIREEPQPESDLKPAGSRFSVFRRASEPEAAAPPPAAPAEPEPENKTGGFLGLFHRSSEMKDDSEEAELFSDTPELASLLRQEREKLSASRPSEPGTVMAMSEDEPQDDDPDTLILELDEKLVSSSAADPVGNEQSVADDKNSSTKTDAVDTADEPRST